MTGAKSDTEAHQTHVVRVELTSAQVLYLYAAGGLTEAMLGGHSDLAALQLGNLREIVEQHGADLPARLDAIFKLRRGVYAAFGAQTPGLGEPAAPAGPAGPEGPCPKT